MVMGSAACATPGAAEATQLRRSYEPADLDGALQLSMPLLIGSGEGKVETRLPFAVDEVLLQGSAGSMLSVR
jgi:hypothetical protein